eukprot:PhF_6_TR38680/c0_g1_i1/m.57867
MNRAQSFHSTFSDPLETIRLHPNAPEVIKHLKTYVKNVIARPYDERYGLINTTKEGFVEKLGSVPGAIQYLMDVVGFVAAEDGDTSLIRLPRVDAAATKERVGHLICCYTKLEDVLREISTAVLSLHILQLQPPKGMDAWVVSLEGVGPLPVRDGTTIPCKVPALKCSVKNGIILHFSTAAGTKIATSDALSCMSLDPNVKYQFVFRKSGSAEVAGVAVVGVQAQLGIEPPLDEEETFALRKTLFAEFVAAQKELAAAAAANT